MAVMNNLPAAHPMVSQASMQWWSWRMPVNVSTA